MMTKGLTYIVKGALTLGLLLGGSCTKKGLDYRKPEGDVTIRLQWEEGAAPAGSRFWFYPLGGGETLVRECTNEGFSGTLPAGTYRVIVSNLDARNVGFRNMEQYDKAEVYVLPDKTLRASGLYIGQPDNLLLAAGLDEGETLVVEDRKAVAATASPRTRTKRVRMFFRIDDTVPVTACGGVFTGVSPAILCATGASAPQSASVGFTASAGAGEYDYAVEISVLDLVEPVAGVPTHELDLTLHKSDQTESKVRIDLTETIREIVDAGGGIALEIPLDITLVSVEGALLVSVKPWDGDGSGSGVL